MSEETEFKQTNRKNRVGPPYSAITLDTCIFQRYGFNFTNGMLANLCSIISIEMIVSEIVVREVFKKLETERMNILKSIQSAHKSSDRLDFLISDDLDQLSEILNEIENLKVSPLWLNYLGSLNAEIIKTEECDIDILTKFYFQSKPPFRAEKDKPEFPDAIALLSLETWAKKNDKKILAISDDNEWLNFSEQSKYIDVISDLEAGLTQIQEVMDEVSDWINNFITTLNEGPNEYLHKEINALLKEKIQSHRGEIDRDGTYSSIDRFDGHITDIRYNDSPLHFSNDKNERNLTIVNSTNESTSFIISLTIIVSAQAYIEHFADIDEDDVYVGDSLDEVENVEIPTRLLFTLNGDLTSKHYIPSIADISIHETLKIPFGAIEPYEDEDDLF